MATHLNITVNLDAVAIENTVKHADLALGAGIMTYAEACCWMYVELERFVTAGA